MAAGVVRTKLSAPRRRSELVERARLTERLASAREAALVLVSAPAGFGKTTLLASVLGDAPGVAWVSLDARDSDAARFWLHVLHALEGASAGCASTALALLDAGSGSLEDVVASLVNEVSVRSEDLTLVLDDYHLAESREVTESVSVLLEHRPPQLHLVLSTRADPALPLSRFRARGDLVELRVADLRLTLGEVGTYLNGVCDLGLSVADVQALESRTEGWAAALQLAALSLRGRADAAEFISSFAGDDRYIVDYLVDEVLDRQPPELRRFLLDTSVLEGLSGSLCDAVTGPVDGMPGGAVLEALERRNLLLVPLDGHRRWYRYHHLFADVLRTRLMAERPGDVPVLHGRASDWCAAAGDVEAAVRHAFAAGDVDRAADLIEVATPGLRRRRAERLQLPWVPLVPTEVLARRPVLASNLIGALLANNVFDGVAERLDALEEALAAPTESLIIRDSREWQRLPALIATHRAALALVAGDVEATRALAQQAVACADEGDELTYASASALMGLASWSTGDLSSAREAYLVATEGLAAQGHVSDVLGCTVTVVELELQLGDLDAADAAAQRALDLAAGLEEAPVRGTADMWVALARVAWERGNTDDAARHLDVAGDLGEEAGLAEQPYRWRVAMAALREAQGDAAAADVLLEEAERLFNSDFSPDATPVPAVRARLHVRTGDLAAAQRWATAAGVAVGDDLAYLHEYEHLTLARLLLAEHAATSDPARAQQALTLLQRLHEAAADAGRTAAVVETSLLLALAHDALGQPEDARRRLQDAVDITGPRGWVRPLLDAGPRLIELLTLLPDQGPLDQVMAATTGLTPADPPASEASTPPGEVAPLVAPLSGRELEVLRLLGSDLDGPAIARHLHVSLPTVRTHTQRIYAKLGVNNRRAAVRRAHQLRL